MKNQKCAESRAPKPPVAHPDQEYLFLFAVYARWIWRAQMLPYQENAKKTKQGLYNVSASYWLESSVISTLSDAPQWGTSGKSVR